ncbi:isochorismatase family protein [Vibrio bivalvicida]|uniref:Isochorismatase n=1 Tax=Vibrio bivalvicida TaxID=1276888 RepID=A0A177XUF2_9VIBR|nr:isochorismatase family protein [Vibrio bivalvicida]OAJ92139.1 isochorismatase [Vibrio bivalvicida]
MTGIPKISPYSIPNKNELPSNQVDWQFDPERAVLLVHDMQKYFVEPFSEEMQSLLIDRVYKLVSYCHDQSVPVCYSAQPGSMTSKQRGLLKDYWGEGMSRDASHTSIVEPLSIREHDWQVVKWRYSAFQKTNLSHMMQEAGRDQLVICGVYAHVGVLMTAVDSFSNDFETFVVADAIADFSRENHLLALDYAARNCAVLTTTEEFV